MLSLELTTGSAVWKKNYVKCRKNFAKWENQKSKQFLQKKAKISSQNAMKNKTKTLKKLKIPTPDYDKRTIYFEINLLTKGLAEEQLKRNKSE